MKISMTICFILASHLLFALEQATATLLKLGTSLPNDDDAAATTKTIDTAGENGRLFIRGSAKTVFRNLPTAVERNNFMTPSMEAAVAPDDPFGVAIPLGQFCDAVKAFLADPNDFFLMTNIHQEITTKIGRLDESSMKKLADLADMSSIQSQLAVLESGWSRMSSGQEVVSTFQAVTGLMQTQMDDLFDMVAGFHVLIPVVKSVVAVPLVVMTRLLEKILISAACCGPPVGPPNIFFRLVQTVLPAFFQVLVEIMSTLKLIFLAPALSAQDQFVKLVQTISTGMDIGLSALISLNTMQLASSP